MWGKCWKQSLGGKMCASAFLLIKSQIYMFSFKHKHPLVPYASVPLRLCVKAPRGNSCRHPLCFLCINISNPTCTHTHTHIDAAWMKLIFKTWISLLTWNKPLVVTWHYIVQVLAQLTYCKHKCKCISSFTHHLQTHTPTKHTNATSLFPTRTGNVVFNFCIKHDVGATRDRISEDTLGVLILSTV